ncbi:MAG: L-2-hydroxyglutarate oxidase [Solirubrobacterales bacterium]|nr:L-2-hydroxyglutarate oxidase [Solirubrobacterales bacterium]
MADGSDFAVVGGGIVGLAVARELLARHPGSSLTLMEREPRLASHQTGHSSGVIHAGIYYRPGSLKARLCVSGARELYEYCDERGIEARREGKLIIAADDSELSRLDELERRGTANAVPGLRRLDASGIADLEPHARGVAALQSPDTGVVDFRAVAESLAADVRAAGGRVVTGCEVSAMEPSAGGVELRHGSSSIHAGFAVVCAGAWSDRLAVSMGAPSEPRIVPFRGAYLRLRPERRSLVRASIYPVPDPELPFLGAHLTRTIDGEVLLGPSALMVGARDAYRPWRLRPRDLAETLSWPGSRRLAMAHWRAGLREIRHAVSRRAFVADARRLLPELTAADTLPGPAGVRGQAVARDGSLIDDFVIHRTGRAVHVRNAPSPAATSALALARLIADETEGG